MNDLSGCIECLYGGYGQSREYSFFIHRKDQPILSGRNCSIFYLWGVKYDKCLYKQGKLSI